MEQLRDNVARFWRAQYGGVLVREFLLLTFMVWVYKFVRYLGRDQVHAAFSNAYRVIQWEHWFELDSESTFQRLVLPHKDLVVAMNRYYVSLHFVGTVAFLVWAFVRSLRDYRQVRRVLLAVTASSLVIHLVFPLAPPRMMPGFIDTMVLYGPNPYRSEAVRSFANQFAAMPSLHVGWALIVAYGVIRISRTRARWLILAHPALTSLAVVLTANHYWLDGLVAAALVGGAVWWLYRPAWVQRDELQPAFA
ncbi:MAG: phosphatase PAP2 family protein [Actinomycetota bacterium]